MQVQALTAKIKEMEDKQAAVAMSSANSPPSKLVAAAAAAAAAARAHAQSAHPELVVAAQAAASSFAQSASAVQALAVPSAKADTKGGGGSGIKGGGGGDEVIPIIIFACCRERYLERTLQTLFERLPKIEGKSFEVWVSQDGQHAGVQALVQNKFPQASSLPISRIFPFFLSESSCVGSVLPVLLSKRCPA